jgi:hypothetical protein
MCVVSWLFPHFNVNYLTFFQPSTSGEQKRKLDSYVSDEGCRDVKIRRTECISPAPRRSNRIRDTNNEKQFLMSSSQTLHQLKLEVCLILFYYECVNCASSSTTNYIKGLLKYPFNCISRHCVDSKSLLRMKITECYELGDGSTDAVSLEFL